MPVRLLSSIKENEAGINKQYLITDAKNKQTYIYMYKSVVKINYSIRPKSISTAGRYIYHMNVFLS